MLQWRFNKNYSVTRCRSALVAFSFLYAIAYCSIYRDSLGLNIVPWASTYALVVIFVMSRAVRIGLREPVIRMSSEAIHLPRALLPPKIIPTRDIKSLEAIQFRGATVGILIGRLGATPRIVEREHFLAPQDFDEFLVELTIGLPHVPLAPKVANDGRRSALSGDRKFPIIGILSIILCVTYALTLDPLSFEIDNRALELGALTKFSVTTSQWYRIPAAFFLHSSPAHLFVNLFSFAIVGRGVNSIIGTPRFVFVLVLSAAFGSISSVVFSSYDYVVGASGGLMGALAIFVSFSLACHQRLPGSVSLPPQLVMLVVGLQLLSDAVTSNVDIVSHIGGGAVGAGYAVWLIKSHSLPIPAASTGSRLLAVTLACAYIAGLCTFLRHYLSFV